MTRPKPSFNLATIDLFSLPIIRSMRDAWRDLPVANLAVRREAKQLLFHDLQVAARNGVPLEEALGLVGQTWGERRQEQKTGGRRGADTRYGRTKLAVVILAAIAGVFTLFLIALMAPAMSSPERVARILALRLERKVRKGLCLSQAMKQFPSDFDPEEAALVAAAEEAGKLPAGLDKLANYQIAAQRETALNGNLGYPLILAALAVMTSTFIIVRIIPTFEDIFAQLGGELPPLTQSVINYASLLLYNGFAALPVVLVLVILFLRTMMNGNSIMRWILAVPIFFLSGLILAPVAVAAFFVLFAGMGSVGGAMTTAPPDTWLPPLLPVYGLLLLLLLPKLMSVVENYILLLERRLARVLSRIPLMASAARAELNARWMAAFALMLEAGTSEAEALRRAGAIAGKRFAAASDRAAALVEKGTSLPRAVEQSGLFADSLAARLALAVSERPLPKRVAEVAGDFAVEATERSARAARVGEVAGILLVGAFVGLIVAAMYMPLFAIPQIVLYQTIQ